MLVKPSVNIKIEILLLGIIFLILFFSWSCLRNIIILRSMGKTSPFICLSILGLKVFFFIIIGKITVVLDLDETLVHCFEELDEKHDIEIPITFPGGHSMVAPVNIRPHAKEILQDLAKDFELMVFTASHEAYANAVINYLDPKK